MPAPNLSRRALTVAALVLASRVAGAVAHEEVAVCPGEGARYLWSGVLWSPDHKCTHDSTHRVCVCVRGTRTVFASNSRITRELSGAITGEGGEPLLALRPAEGEMADLMVLYGLGSAALFGVFLLMTWRAWAWRERLQLDDRERLLTLAGLWSHGISMGFGVTSALLAGVNPPLAGFLYLGLGPVQVVNGLHWERRVERLLPEVTQDEIPPDIGAGAP